MKIHRGNHSKALTSTVSTMNARRNRASLLVAERLRRIGSSVLTTTRRVLIADAHPLVCRALSEMLRMEFQHSATSIETVTDGDALLSRVKLGAVDLLLVDPQLPGSQEGMALLRALVSSRPDTRIVVHTGHAHSSFALAAFELGVRGYVSKKSEPHLIIEALRAVSAGERFLEPFMDLDLARNHPWRRLTFAEEKVVLALAHGNSLQAIADSRGRSYKTVTTHKYNAFKKLGLGVKADICAYLETNGLDYLLTEFESI